MTKNGSNQKSFYNLIVVCVHTGSLSGGHYFTYAKHHLTNKWYCFDDRSFVVIYQNNLMKIESIRLFLSNSNNDCHRWHSSHGEFISFNELILQRLLLLGQSEIELITNQTQLNSDKLLLKLDEKKRK